MKRELTTTYINWLKELYEVCIQSLKCLRISLGFPSSSVGEESTCNAGDPGLIPGLGRSVGEGIDHPLQYSWASLVDQFVKNLPSMWETWVHSSILAWRVPWTHSPWGRKESDTTEPLSLSSHFSLEIRGLREWCSNRWDESKQLLRGEFPIIYFLKRTRLAAKNLGNRLDGFAEQKVDYLVIA